VFRTYEPARDRLVAVKAFRLDVTPEQARALADELERLTEAPLDHPSIVRPLAAGVEGSLAFLAFEYIAAESLDIAMRHYAPAALDKVLPFITQLAGAIDFARAAGIGHGALHPRDIFVTPDDARANGFGVVQAVERIGLRAPVRRPYSAPERVEGGAWDVRADVYALTAIAYELLTGKRPVGADVGHLGETAGPYAANIAAVFARGLAADPSARYDGALAFAGAFEAAARGERPTGAIEQGRAITGAAAAPATIVTAETVLPDGVSSRDEIEEGRRSLTFESELDQQARDQFDFDRIDRDYADIDDIEVGHEADLEEIQLREQEAIEQVAPPTTPEDRPHPAPDVMPEPQVEPQETSDLQLETRSQREPAPAFDLEATRGIETERGHRDRPAAAYPAYSQDTADDTADRRGYASPRPVILPVALTLLLGLFVGFLAGYLVGAREHPGQEVPSPASAENGRPSRGPAEAETSSAPPQRTSSTPPAAPSTASRQQAASPARQTARPRPAAQGRLVVRSTPPGAQVYVNGRRRGATPVAVRDLAPGTYTVRVARSGYREQSQRVSVSASGTRDVSFRLQRPAAAAAPTASSGVFTGSVFVDSRPRGARVLLDNKEIGVTPIQVGDVSVGSHVVRLELPDHRPWTTATRVSAGQVSSVRASLERVR
jgi:hypothetical protein